MQDFLSKAKAKLHATKMKNLGFKVSTKTSKPFGSIVYRVISKKK